jgi:putative NADH-flavin reductase
MSVAIVGASGRIGSKILAEALSRHHSVTAIARNADKIPAQPNVTIRQGDIGTPAIADILHGHDAVIVSIPFGKIIAKDVVAAVKAAGVKRLLVVGGAGSLRGTDGVAIIDGPSFPEAWKPQAGAARDFLYGLKEEHALDWTYLSPSALIGPGERTGNFRLGLDDLLVGADGQSRISFDDYAVALVDELEQPKHNHRRFTVGY